MPNAIPIPLLVLVHPAAQEYPSLARAHSEHGGIPVPVPTDVFIECLKVASLIDSHSVMQPEAAQFFESVYNGAKGRRNDYSFPPIVFEFGKDTQFTNTASPGATSVSSLITNAPSASTPSNHASGNNEVVFLSQRLKVVQGKLQEAEKKLKQFDNVSNLVKTHDLKLKELETLKHQVKDLSSKHQSINDKITTHNAKFAKLEETNKAVEKGMGTIGNKMVSLEQSLGQLKDTGPFKDANKLKSMENLLGKVLSKNGDLENRLNSQIQKLSKLDHVESQEKEIAAVGMKVASLEVLLTKFNPGKLDHFSSRLNSVTDRLNSLSTTINAESALHPTTVASGMETATDPLVSIGKTDKMSQGLCGHDNAKEESESGSDESHRCALHD